MNPLPRSHIQRYPNRQYRSFGIFNLHHYLVESNDRTVRLFSYFKYGVSMTGILKFGM